MQLKINYSQNRSRKTKVLPMYKQGVLYTIDNFLKCDILNNNQVKVSDIKNLDIIYQNNELVSQTTKRIVSIILKVIKSIKNI
ncbi:MAG: hypothetical protein WC422_02610 [Candidatus Paceibacterota bacterium]